MEPWSGMVGSWTKHDWPDYLIRIKAKLTGTQKCCCVTFSYAVVLVSWQIVIWFFISILTLEIDIFPIHWPLLMNWKRFRITGPLWVHNWLVFIALEVSLTSIWIGWIEKSRVGGDLRHHNIHETFTVMLNWNLKHSACSTHGTIFFKKQMNCFHKCENVKFRNYRINCCGFRSNYM